ncbi:MAG TPA: polysaccharide biosynthesis/export family protein [Bryobacteraceae bacterium]|nr:polysaccharide biosynthesis/export family protein [Bryobacteraceae bacterium]
MKLLHIRGGILALGAWVALAQTPPAAPPSVAKAPESGAKQPIIVAAPDDGGLAFKPAPETGKTPQPATVPSSPSAGSQSVPVAAAAAGPGVLENESASARPKPAMVQLTSAGKPVKAYVIGPLDVLEVKVWNNANLSNIADVRTDGIISMPLVGEVMASGLTVAELTAAIKDKLNAVIIEPEVNIQVVRYNSKKYSIFGGCLRQGEFPLVGEVTVLDAFANCGGFKDFADLKKIYILRGQQKLKFNYRDVIKGKRMEQNISLENGDRIVVPE